MLIDMVLIHIFLYGPIGLIAAQVILQRGNRRTGTG